MDNLKDVLQELTVLARDENYVGNLSEVARDFIGLMNPWNATSEKLTPDLSKEHIAQIRKIFNAVSPTEEFANAHSVAKNIINEQIKYAKEVAEAMAKHGIDPKSEVGQQFMKDMAQAVKIKGKDILFPKADIIAQDVKKAIEDNQKESGNLFNQFGKICFDNPKTSMGVGAVFGLGGLWYLLDSVGVLDKKSDQQQVAEQTEPKPERSLASRSIQGVLSALAIGLGIFGMHKGYKGMTP